MKAVAGKVVLSASDIASSLECRHLVELDVAVVRGERARPAHYEDPALELLVERGFEHEQRYVEHLAAREVLEVPQGDDAVAATVAAMRRGVDVIVQGHLAYGRWQGRPDLLRRVERPSDLGAWSYEVIDTKLAAATKARTILQLCLYSELLAAIHGTVPEHFHVVAPGDHDGTFDEQTYRTAAFGAYYRLVRERLAAAVPESIAAERPMVDTYPDPTEHCDVCRWWADCNDRRRRDDSVWLVAGVTRAHRRELKTYGIETLAELGAHPGDFEPERVSVESLNKVREQARVQLAGRIRGVPIFELLPLEAGRGLARLPEPSPGDVFFDIEGDRMGLADGREFLFGLAWGGAGAEVQYRGHWGLTDAEERRAFEATVDLLLNQWARHPGMHVYHYAPYEPAALKRLMGRHASREADIDRMLRAGLFVDLHTVVKQSLIASVERYSLKDLEQLFAFERSGALREAGRVVRAVQLALGRGVPGEIDADTKALVEAYNRDDCLSARALRDWLEGLRTDCVASGGAIPRPEPMDGEPPENVSERAARIQAVVERLLAHVPDDVEARTADDEARVLLANLLEYHRREEKVAHWEFFRLCDLDADAFIEERAGLGGLDFEGQVGASKTGLPIHRYRFPEQETDVRAGSSVVAGSDGKGIGSVTAFDQEARTVDLQKTKARRDEHPPAVFLDDRIRGTMADSLLRFGSHVAEHGLSAISPFGSAVRLLRKEPPALPVLQDRETASSLALRIAPDLADTVLPIQGPPGAGKTYTAARMILGLVRAGKRVGVTAVSHKVIRNLLEEVCKAAKEAGDDVSCQHLNKYGVSDESSAVKTVKTDKALFKALEDGAAQVAGGTAFLWAKEPAIGALDVLFVDEAGQMALANVLAVAPAAPTMVLLGDPQQLEQPRKGSHPDGADVSALDHLLDGHPTIPEGRGLFLGVTWRLAPAICRFTSELFYEGRLQPRPELERQTLSGCGVFDGAGLFYVPVDHDGNQNSSREEGEVVHRIAQQLLNGGTWTDAKGNQAPLRPADILVVAPYNAQVDHLRNRLEPLGLRVGTVDKFQGQEAPIVLYSMATSRPEDAPRGMEFLYSPNRFNVATSRARCAVVLVASPRLFEPECRSPRQMELANVLCRYLEVAREVPA